jgi:hypothetical protein
MTSHHNKPSDEKHLTAKDAKKTRKDRKANPLPAFLVLVAAFFGDLGGQELSAHERWPRLDSPQTPS